ncbi:MAG TPA: serine hydrolase domain-containing protein [Anaerolineae bacterium]
MPTIAFDSILPHQLTRVVRRTLQDNATLGAAVALLVDGRALLHTGVGFRDATETTALVPDAQFYLYSITKTIVAIATLQLVDRGQLALDDVVHTYLPELPLDVPLTVRQLLNHTSGLPDYGGMPIYHQAVADRPGDPWTPEQFLQQTLANGLKYRPGEGWGYSNVGYLVLKLLIEQVTNASLRQVLQEQIFAPLELQQTAVAETLEDTQSLTPGYSTLSSPDGSLHDVASRYHPGWVSHGVVVSTAPELTRIFQALFDDQLLPPALRQAMLVPVLVPGQHPLFHQPAYGLGVMIDPQSPYGSVVGHGGGGPGYSTAALHFQNVAGHGVVSVALANRDQPDLGLTIAFQLVDTLANELPTA